MQLLLAFTLREKPMNTRSEMIAFAKKLGFKMTILNNNHIKFSGYGYFRIAASSPSDYRVLRKVKKDLQSIIDGKPSNHVHLEFRSVA